MKAIVFYSPGHIALEDVQKPEPNENQVLIRVRYTGICGTDVHIYDPRVALPVQRVYGRKSPVVIGHELSGDIVAIGKEVTDFKVGDKVCGSQVHAFAEYVVASPHSIHKIPNGISFEEAAVMDPFSLALETMNVVRPAIGERIAIIGQGPVGLAHTQIAKLAGVEVIALDLVEQRLSLSSAFGADHVVNVRELQPRNSILALTDGVGVDITIDASGRLEGIQMSTAIVKRGGRVFLVGGGPGDIADDIFQKELVVHGIFSKGLKYEQALRMLSTKRILVRPIITDILPLEQAGEAFEGLLRQPDKHIKILLVH